MMFYRYALGRSNNKGYRRSQGISLDSIWRDVPQVKRSNPVVAQDGFVLSNKKEKRATNRRETRYLVQRQVNYDCCVFSESNQS